MLLNLGDGTFAESASAFGADSLGDGRGVAVADLTGDGGLDLLVNNDRSQAQLFVNHAPRGAWLRVKLRGTQSNRDGIGAIVRVTAGGVTQMRVICAGDGYASQSSRIAHFGIGTDTAIASLEVTWPSGVVTRLGAQRSGRTVLVSEDQTADAAPTVTSSK